MKDRAEQRKVQLPKGNWYCFYTGKLLGGDKTITVTAKELQDRAPLFVKEGAVIPMLTEAVNTTKDAYGHPLELRVYGKNGGSCELYEDDGKSFDYQQGKFRIRRLDVSKDGKLSEKVLKGDAPAMFGKVEVTKVMGE